MALGNLIKAWENIMRDDDGVNGTVQVLSQLVWMLFLKVYDVKEDMWELYEDNFESAIPENCRWRNWAKGKSQKDKMTGDALVDFVDNKLFPTLKGLTVTAESSKRRTIVREMMTESYNYMKDGVCIRKAVNLLDGIDFDDQNERHDFNIIYETLLRGLQSAGRSGEFYTPRALTQLITEKVNPQLGKITADFACGTGGFLVDAVEHLRKQVTRAEDAATIEKTVFGVEKKQFPYMLCTTNMLLHDVDYPRITHDNSLMKNVRDYRPSEKVDFILMNPPYGGHEQDGIQVNFPSKLRSSETANLFMIEILYRLNDGGRCGVILPDGFLQNDDTSLIAIKEKLFKECNVHTIIRLPGSCFSPYTSIATNLLFFDKTGSTTETWFYRFDLPKGQKFSMKKNPIDREKLSAIDDWWEHRREIKDVKDDESLTATWKSQLVPFKTIEGRNYNLDFCGFPNEEKVILSPEETLDAYESEREHLENDLAMATSTLRLLLHGEQIPPFNIANTAMRLGILNSQFPEKMRVAILQAAIQGKLTEQLTSDSSVKDLLSIIEEEKNILVKARKLKKQSPRPVDVNNIPFEIPDEWMWVTLPVIAQSGLGKTLNRGTDVGIEVPYLCSINVYSTGINLNTIKTARFTPNDMEKYRLQKGDLLICEGGDAGRSCVWNCDKEMYYQNALHRVRFFGNVNSYFFNYVLLLYKANGIIASHLKGETIKHLVQNELYSLPLPLPPIEEQQRIVDRLNDLIPLCESFVK